MRPDVPVGITFVLCLPLAGRDLCMFGPAICACIPDRLISALRPCTEQSAHQEESVRLQHCLSTPAQHPFGSNRIPLPREVVSTRSIAALWAVLVYLKIRAAQLAAVSHADTLGVQNFSYTCYL